MTKYQPVLQLDVCSAFLNAEVEEDVHLKNLVKKPGYEEALEAERLNGSH